MKLRPDHAGISVADLQASIAWYRDMLGFELLREVEIPDGHGHVALVKNGSFILELFCVPGAKPLPDERRHPATDLLTHGIKHVAYATPDIDVAHERAQGQGGRRRVGHRGARRR